MTLPGLNWPGAAAAAGSKPADSPERVKNAAQQFEALLIGQMLKAAAASDSDSDPAGCTALQMAQEQLAAAIAARGGLGLAGLIEKSLSRTAVTPPRSNHSQ